MSAQLTRRQFLAQGAVLGAAAVPLLSAKGTATAAPIIRPMERRPNILYVIIEDIGPQMGCYGTPLVKTPVLDRFAAGGVRFTNAFCAAPVCSVSRSALMTGCYPIATGAHQHRTWPWNRRPLPAPAKHLCDWFRAAGYFTCNLQPEKKTEGLNGPKGAGKLDLNFEVSSPKAGDPFDGRDWNQRAKDQPFFAHITLIETHTGPGWKVARQQPAAELVDPNQVRLPPYYPDHPVARDEYANYLDAIHLADGYVAQVLARLEQEGLAKDTIVVISSDHGPMFRGKQFLYDEGLRIPLIVKFPDGRGAGTVDDRLVSGVDIAPTILGFAGIGLPAGAAHGHDLFASAAPHRSHVFAGRDRMDESTDRMRAVRTDRFKYIRNYFPAIPYMQYNAYKERSYPTWNLVKRLAKEGKLTPEAALFTAERKPIEELYDLAADPHEVRNLAGDAAHTATLKELRGLVDGWIKDTGDQGVNGEDPLDVFRGYNGYLPGDPPPEKRPRYES